MTIHSSFLPLFRLRQSLKRVKDFSYRYIAHIFYGRIQRATRCWFGKVLLNDVHCNAAKVAVLNNLQPVSSGRKRGRGDPGRVGFYKWFRNFAVISVGKVKVE